ncbi:MAG: hypothetical protein WEB58_10655 [Planctomycetaceae bacterium]
MQSLMCLGLIAVMTMVSGCGSAASEAKATAEKADSYRHHLFLVWSIDKTTHAVKGFDEGIIAPSQEIALNPVADYAVNIRTGAIEDVTVTDFKTEWQEKRLPYTISFATTRMEGSHDLVEPFLHFEYGTTKKAKNLDSILIGIPVGPSGTKTYLSEIDRVGAADALEDLVLMAAAERESPLDLGDLLQTYNLLGSSKKLNRWKDLLKKGTPKQRLDAAGVLMSLGDAEGRRTFCKFCLETKGNLQVDLVDILVQMPASDEALSTMVKLLVLPRLYLTQAPDGVGVADIERRYGLIRALSEDYSRGALKPYATELLQWAKSEMGQKYGGDELLKLLDDK